MKYVGRYPDADFSVVYKDYVDSSYAAVRVDSDFVQQTVAGEAQYLVDKAYVDQQDNFRAKKSQVDAADALYLPKSQKGSPNGIASLDEFGYVYSSQVPSTIVTERTPVS